MKQPSEQDGEPVQGQLAAGVFVLPDGSMATWAADGVNPAKLFLSAVDSIVIQLLEDLERARPSRIAVPKGPLPPFPSGLVG